MSPAADPYRSVPASPRPTGLPTRRPTGTAGVDGVDGVERTPGQRDEHGAIYYPGDEEAQRAPGSALVLLVLSLVAGGLYGWLFWPQKASFDWASALTLKSSEFAVLGGLVMWGGGVLFIRHGLIWAARTGAIIAAAPTARQFIDALTATGAGQTGSAALSFLLGGGPALLVLALSFSPSSSRWRHRRRQTVAAQARARRDQRSRLGGGTSRPVG